MRQVHGAAYNFCQTNINKNNKSGIMMQARKKSTRVNGTQGRIRHLLGESFLILAILLAVYLGACLGTYSPTDPGPFNTISSWGKSCLSRRTRS